MNKILILLLVIGYGIAGTEDYNYKCEKAQQHNKKETCKVVAGVIAANAITHAQTASMKFMLAPS